MVVGSIISKIKLIVGNKKSNIVSTWFNNVQTFIFAAMILIIQYLVICHQYLVNVLVARECTAFKMKYVVILFFLSWL